MSWARAVWFEGKKEFEDVVPTNWIKTNGDERVLLWPSSADNCKSILENQEEPKDDWSSFKLKKIKITHGELFNYAILWLHLTYRFFFKKGPKS